MIGLAPLAHLVEVASGPHRMAQLDAVAVGHAPDSGLGPEAAGPAGLGFPPAEEAGALGEFGEHIAIVVFQPRVKAAAADVLDRVEDADGDQFADG